MAGIRDCVVLGDASTCLADAGGRPLAFWLMREWMRFGLHRFVFGWGGGAGEAQLLAAAEALPRRVGIEFAGTMEGFAEPWVLLCRGDRVLHGNPAALFAGGDWGSGRVLVSTRDESLGVAVARSDVVRSADR